MLSTSLLWGRFWCSREEKLIKSLCLGFWAWPLAIPKNTSAGTSGWSVPISQSQTTVFVGQWMEWDSLPPCWKVRNHVEVLHLYRWDTHTHLLRNIIANFCCGMHLTCKKQSIKTWQENWVDSTRTSVRSMLSTSLLKGRFWCSWTIHTWSKVIPDCDNSAGKINCSKRRLGGSWVSHVPLLKTLEW